MSLPAQAENLLKIGILHHESHSAEEVEECLKLASSHLQVAKATQFDMKVRGKRRPERDGLPQERPCAAG